VKKAVIYTSAFSCSGVSNARKFCALTFVNADYAQLFYLYILLARKTTQDRGIRLVFTKNNAMVSK
jgi:hypothetical protein